MATNCTHLDQINDVEPRTPEGCEECLKAGDRWVHLRLCLTCGHVGCCDSSPNKHATKHFHATQHPIVQSFEPNEDWSWCYVDEVVLEPADVEAATGASTNSSGNNAAESGGSGSGRPGGLLSRLLGSPNHRNHVVGVIEDSTTARRAAEALQQEGFDSDDIVLQTGQEIEQRMQNDDIGNLVREAASEEGAICRDFDEQARGGRAILSVYTDQEDEVERVQGIMTQHGARSLKYFGDWTISNL